MAFDPIMWKIFMRCCSARGIVKMSLMLDSKKATKLQMFHCKFFLFFVFNSEFFLQENNPIDQLNDYDEMFLEDKFVNEAL